ncbi:BglG family transcription antiterminator [Mitsuokella sp.]|uniref:BglG family transcription antiterminator n=1 Tax=Mitsuokella TaxID=52225 RepID=UPI0029E2C6DD|nr:BglG family transcription antiterminator [Mitsuokella sp.]MDD6381925.1 BglG family transcription antiterminator [Selenomonadaceae bacterium]MDY4474702.1 BglG family transcription antiterminator [Mitsuokella sp.]
MRKQEREKKIMEMLLEKSNGLTGDELAKQLGVSSRTVRSDIKEITEKLAPLGSHIIAAPNKGYRLIQMDQEEDLLQAVTEEEHGIGHESVKEQQNYIISRFLICCLQDKAITQMNLADDMYLGISTIKKYLGEVRGRFQEYALSIEQYRTDGLRLAGDEGNIRTFFVDFLQNVRDTEILKILFDKVSQKDMENILMRIPSLRKLQLTDTARQSLIVQSALSIYRSEHGHLLECPASLAQKLENTFEYVCAKDVANELFRYIGVDLSYSEVFYLTRCLLTSKKLLDIGDSINDEHMKQLVEKVLTAVDDQFGYDFRSDDYLKDGLILHLRIAIARVNFRVAIRNEMLETVKQDYPLAFQIAVYAAQVMRDIEGIVFNENEIGYIALHFGASMSRRGMEEAAKPKRVYIVCSAGLGVSIMLRAKIQEYFHSDIHVLGVLPAYKLTDEMIEEADYIFSTVQVPFASPKIIRVNHMLRKEDIARIQRVVFHRNADVQAKEIQEFFHASSFFADKDFKTRDECLEFLTEQAMQAGYLDEKGKASVFEREKMSSTAIGDLAAIPHAFNTAKAVSNISVLLLQSPIDWGGMPVQVIFLLSIEQRKAAVWEKVFLKLYDFIKEGRGIERLLKYRSYDKFIADFEAVL